MSYWKRWSEWRTKKKIMAVSALFVLPCLYVVRKIWIHHQSKKEKTLFDVLAGNVKSKSQLKKSIFKADAQIKELPKLPPLPRPTSPNTPRFDFSDPTQAAEGIRYLEEYGYVVASNVLTIEDIEKAKSLFWGWVKGLLERFPTHFNAKEKVSWVKPDDVQTWGHRNWPADPATGIVFGRGIGQSAFLWFVRSRPMVKKVFSQVWETSDLLVSYDACGVFRPWRFQASWKTKGGWYHVDQNSDSKRGKHCVQGLVSMYDGGPSTGGLTVIPGSHKQFKQIGDRNPGKNKNDLTIIPLDDPILQKPGQLVSCKAGDLLLWDSRTIHCNSPGDYCQEQQKKDQNEEIHVEKDKQVNEKEGTDNGSWDLIRLVAYICMTPRNKATPSVLEKRRLAVEKNVSTNHWPHEFHGDNGSPPLVVSNSPYVQNDLI